MSIQFECQHCGKSLTTSDEKAGRKAKCPGCGEVLTVPEPDSAGFDESDVDDRKAPSPPPLPAASDRTGTKTCPMCGAEVSRRAQKCDACGEEFDEESLPRKRSRKRGHQVIDAMDVFSTTWRIFQQNIGLLLGVVGVCFALGIVAYGVMFAVMFAITGGMPGERELDQPDTIMIFVVVMFLLIFGVTGLYLNIGINKLMLAIARGDKAELGMIFGGGRYVARAFLVGFLYQLMVTAGSYCCVIPGILLTLMFWPYLYIIVDEDCPGMDSLSKAKEITSKNWLSCFVLQLLSSLVGSLLMLTIIGIPFVLAFNMLVYAVAYCKMSGQQTAA